MRNILNTKKRKILAVCGLFLILGSASLGAYYYQYKAFPLFLYQVRNVFRSAGNPDKIGWITDIHADRYKRRTVDSGTIYPRQYDEYLNKVFSAMREQNVRTVISSGDNTNSGDDNYARKLNEIAIRNGMNVIWTRGNHDNDKVMEILEGKESQYYFEDIGNTRIIVINNVVSDTPNWYSGEIDAEQLNWISSAIKTDKQVIISMHIPIFAEGKLLEQYREFEKIISESRNVKVVLSGHLHIPSQNEYNGIKYYIEGALTYEGAKGAYGIIDLKDLSVDYKRL